MTVRSFHPRTFPRPPTPDRRSGWTMIDDDLEETTWRGLGPLRVRGPRRDSGPYGPTIVVAADVDGGRARNKLAGAMVCDVSALRPRLPVHCPYNVFRRQISHPACNWWRWDMNWGPLQKRRPAPLGSGSGSTGSSPDFDRIPRPASLIWTHVPQHSDGGVRWPELFPPKEYLSDQGSGACFAMDRGAVRRANCVRHFAPPPGEQGGNLNLRLTWRALAAGDAGDFHRAWLEGRLSLSPPGPERILDRNVAFHPWDLPRPSCSASLPRLAGGYCAAAFPLERWGGQGHEPRWNEGR